MDKGKECSQAETNTSKKEKKGCANCTIKPLPCKNQHAVIVQAQELSATHYYLCEDWSISKTGWARVGWRERAAQGWSVSPTWNWMLDEGETRSQSLPGEATYPLVPVMLCCDSFLRHTGEESMEGHTSGHWWRWLGIAAWGSGQHLETRPLALPSPSHRGGSPGRQGPK